MKSLIQLIESADTIEFPVIETTDTPWINPVPEEWVQKTKTWLQTLPGGEGTHWDFLEQQRMVLTVREKMDFINTFGADAFLDLTTIFSYEEKKLQLRSLLNTTKDMRLPTTYEQ